MNNILFKKIDNARLNIFMNDPFLGYLLQNFNVIIDDNIKTAFTDGINIFIGNSFLETLNLEETAFILLHELLHIVLGHIERGRQYNSTRFNIACDIVVNDILDLYLHEPGALKPIYGKDYSIQSLNLTTEEVYNLLPSNISGELLDCHSNWALLSQNEIILSNVIFEKISQELTNKRYITRIESIRNEINSRIKRKYKNNWKQILKRYITFDLKDYSFEKLDYRYKDILLPSYTESEQELKDVWFVIDVSGSMSNDLINIMFQEVETIIKEYKSISCKVSFFSNETTKPILFNNKKSFYKTRKNIKTTWGTNFEQIFLDLNKHFITRKPKLIIILTDGYGKVPKRKTRRNIPVIWCSNNKEFKPHYGKTIYI